jgi:microcystin-dependent protein
MFPTSPVGFLVCDGSTISRATYAELYALANSSGLIGTVFGSGDGSTTFTLPDMRGRTIVGVGTNADVSTLGATDNLAVASRTPKHTHTVPSHTHSIPPHYHSTRSSGADINITSSGTHNHGPGAGTAFLTTAGGAATPSGAFYAGPTATPATTADASHTHANSSFSGRVGLVTGGSNGDLPMTSGAESLTSDVTTVPYIAMNFIIKATYSTLLGDSNAEANEAFTVFMGG